MSKYILHYKLSVLRLPVASHHTHLQEETNEALTAKNQSDPTGFISLSSPTVVLKLNGYDAAEFKIGGGVDGPFV